jgi:PKD domain
VRIFARSRPALRGLLPLTAILAVLAAALLAAAAPAGAKVVEVGGNKFGTLAHNEKGFWEEGGLEPAAFANNSGNPVVHGNSIFVDYWDPSYRYHDDWMKGIDAFFHDMNAASGSLENVFAVDAQYTDKSNGPARFDTTFHGSYHDTAPYPAAECTDPQPLEAGDAVTCLTDKQIRQHLEGFISSHGLPKGMGDIYYVLVPPGVTTCTDEGPSASHCSSNQSEATSFCSYHSAITPTNPTTGDGNTILYAVIPWSAGGYGDPLLKPADQTIQVNCQDGGLNQEAKGTPTHEKKKVKDAKEKEAFNNMNAEEKEKALRAEELEGPHQQQPNQVNCPTAYDGGCDTGLTDVILNQISLEQQDIVTDPLLNAWQTPASHDEAGDECRNFFRPILGGSVTANEESAAGTLYDQSFGGGIYYLNTAFNVAAYKLYQPGGACLTHVNLAPSFTTPSPVGAGEIVGFNGMESNISLNVATDFPGGGAPSQTYATYTWNFGDGTPTVTGYAPGSPPCESPWLSPCAGSVFHSYRYGGTYPVTLTVTDVGGDTASYSQDVSVVGPPPPSEAPVSPPASGGSSTAGTAGSSAGSTGGGGATGAHQGAGKAAVPVAVAAVLTHSLRSAVSKGILISYAVNEQVAGHFELLLSRATASHLGISGPPAVGLPAGSAPAIIVGKAILVTTEGGRSSVKIVFSKRIASRLARARKVSLTLRMIVHSAGSSPASSSFIGSFTLTH